MESEEFEEKEKCGDIERESQNTPRFWVVPQREVGLVEKEKGNGVNGKTTAC